MGRVELVAGLLITAAAGGIYVAARNSLAESAQSAVSETDQQRGVTEQDDTCTPDKRGNLYCGDIIILGSSPHSNLDSQGTGSVEATNDSGSSTTLQFDRGVASADGGKNCQYQIKQTPPTHRGGKPSIIGGKRTCILTPGEQRYPTPPSRIPPSPNTMGRR